MAKIFEPTEDFFWNNDEGQPIAHYLAGFKYACADDNSKLAAMLDQWIAAGKVKFIEDTRGTAPSMMGGTGTVS